MLRDVLSHALRQTWRSRRVSVVIVATVAIAGAAGSVLLAAAGSFLSVRIPGVDTDALAEAFHTYRGVRYAWSLPLVEEFAASAHHAVYAGGSVILKTIDTPSGPAWVKIETVTTNYSDVIGVRPIAGRWFTADENSVPMRDHVALLSESLCRRAFAGPDRCLGSRIGMGAATLTVVGVMPAPFRGTHGDTDAWVPLMLAPLGIGRAGQPFPFWTSPGSHWMQL